MHYHKNLQMNMNTLSSFPFYIKCNMVYVLGFMEYFDIVYFNIALLISGIHKI